jgi:hypothetical protein
MKAILSNLFESCIINQNLLSVFNIRDKLKDDMQNLYTNISDTWSEIIDLDNKRIILERKIQKKIDKLDKQKLTKNFVKVDINKIPELKEYVHISNKMDIQARKADKNKIEVKYIINKLIDHRLDIIASKPIDPNLKQEAIWDIEIATDFKKDLENWDFYKFFIKEHEVQPWENLDDIIDF